jgi:hypothetical protein
MDSNLLDSIKQRISKNEYDNYENLLLPSLSYTQSKLAYDTLIKFKKLSKPDDYVCYGSWGQLNQMYCLNNNNEFYIFTIIEIHDDECIHNSSYKIQSLFQLNDDYLYTLNID